MDSVERNDNLGPFTDASSDGDVILVVGPQNVRLKVHSQCLRCASKVFNAMLGPQWREGQEPSKGLLQEVALVEDDADALRTICCVIHHRNDDVPQSITPHEVLEIAIEADKYDFILALKYASIQWLKPRPNAEREDMGYLLAAAFLFADTDIFVAHTLTLMLHHKGSYMAFLEDETISSIVPRKTFYLLEERRTRMRAELSQLLIGGKNAGCSCGWGKDRSDAYTQLLSEYGQLKMLEVNIADIFKKMEDCSVNDMNERWHETTYRGYYHKTLTYEESLYGMLEGKQLLDKLLKEFAICGSLKHLTKNDPIYSIRWSYLISLLTLKSSNLDRSCPNGRPASPPETNTFIAAGLIHKDKVIRGETRNLVQIVVTQIHIPSIRNTTNLLLGLAETLFTFLERAEVEATRVKQGEGLTRSTKTWVRKRRRDSTPPEQLKSDREGRFAEEEQRAAKKAMTDDVSYKASSSDADVE